MVSEIVLLVTEWIGTISFAVSGSLVAIRHDLDLFGVATVGAITAIGGGIMRDTMIGNTPPKIFYNPLILLVAVITSLIVFLITYFYRKNFKKISEKIDNINILFDALGLSSFSIAGTEVAFLASLQDNVLLVITLGVITGVGGGILRDVLVNEKPYILTKHIYAVVSILGCCLYYLISVCLNYKVFATVFVMIFTVLIRLLAARFHWKLPKIKIDKKETN
ncbi:MAG: trimeric intracellular cation channel family protein [Clostridia bacterium]|nr:trimeric intracellular cation channel family protein [Clostridia bacterium]MBR6741150.1 trimeric intracellular cation channel family protein [Clostridia bacterium]